MNEADLLQQYDRSAAMHQTLCGVHIVLCGIHPVFYKHSPMGATELSYSSCYANNTTFLQTDVRWQQASYSLRSA